ncbi:hypothetical protein AB835_02470 [Candidatus Endobugula sertula]|uniref:DinB-like domain-containing protein n=1 Tax=Candidatus Endobugula sertula TaxID=62101 RepID=A0A1D2QSP4_9GAMM|nr:hypothetical protein AB835_02470 [Candidatus Endobugula sertula]
MPKGITDNNTQPAYEKSTRQYNNTWEFLLSALLTDLSDLIHCNLKTLANGAKTIQSLPADQYNYIEKPYFESCPGKHMRHILDHYLCFIRDLNSGVINYEQRDRDHQLESDQGYALTIIQRICSFLQQLCQNNTQDRSVRILLCNDVTLPQGETTKSSIRRELQFLQGHTVHHFALIATMLRFYGLEVPRDFSIAPSTLVHEETVKHSA